MWTEHADPMINPGMVCRSFLQNVFTYALRPDLNTCLTLPTSARLHLTRLHYAECTHVVHAMQSSTTKKAQPQL